MIVEKIDPFDSKYFPNEPDLYLALLADYLTALKNSGGYYVGNGPSVLVPKAASEYLKVTDQYRKQFELCLKMFDGRKSEVFTDSFVMGVKSLFDQYVDELIQDLLQFADSNVNKKKQLDLNFEEETIQNVYFKQRLHEKFEHYGKNNWKKDKPPHECRLARIYFSSKTTRSKFEGKLRKLGKYASIHDALEFIEIRIGLFGHYRYKKLVDDLDELTTDYLINSSTGQVKKGKKELSMKKLIEKAFKKYEIYDSPQYLIDENAFKAALRSKFQSTLKK